AALLKQELYCNSCKPNYTNKLLVSSVEYSQTSSPANEQWKMIKNFMINIEKRLNDLEKNRSLAPVQSVQPAAIISPSMPPTYAQQVITNTQLNRSNHQDPNYSQQIVIPPRPIVTSQATTNLQLNRNTVLPTKHTDFSRSLIIYPKVIMNVKWDTKTIMENFRSATENLQIKFVPQYAYPHPQGLWDKTTFGGDFNVYEPKDNFSVTLNDPIILVAIYNEPNSTKALKQLYKTYSKIRQMSRHIIFCGDLNARNTEWDDRRTNSVGEFISAFMAAKDLHLLNEYGEITFENTRGFNSIIDLSFCTDDVLEYEPRWRVQPILPTPDHKPILLELNNTEPQRQEPHLTAIKWNYAECNWKEFEDEVTKLCQEQQVDKIMLTSKNKIDQVAKLIEELILNAAYKHIPCKRVTVRSKGWCPRR
ncbi:unnamed protein product, partial [Didymodactylos carnosus]